MILPHFRSKLSICFWFSGRKPMLLLFSINPPDGNQVQAQITDSFQDPMQGSLVWQFSRQDCFFVVYISDGHAVKPICPQLIDKTLNPDFICNRHSFHSSSDTLLNNQFRICETFSLSIKLVCSLESQDGQKPPAELPI
jgi:hypothetical protein